MKQKHCKTKNVYVYFIQIINIKIYIVKYGLRRSEGQMGREENVSIFKKTEALCKMMKS